jgi:uncharacterized membrane protein
MLVINYFIALGLFLGIDKIWLTVTKKLYREQIGYLLKKKVNITAALVFYALFVVGLVLLVIEPADSWVVVLWQGALFGLITYSTYDLTNLATVDKWPLKITIIDMIWGSVLGSSVSTLTYLITGLF